MPVKEYLRDLYRKYNKCLINRNISGAKHYASDYNHLLRCAGGPEKVQGEYYLSLGDL